MIHVAEAFNFFSRPPTPQAAKPWIPNLVYSLAPYTPTESEGLSRFPKIESQNLEFRPATAGAATRRVSRLCER